MGRVRRAVGLAGVTLAWLAFAPGVAGAEISLNVCVKQDCESVVLPADDIPHVGSGLSVPLISWQLCSALGRDLGDTEIPVGEDSVAICPSSRYGFTAVEAEVGGKRVRDTSYYGGLGPNCPCTSQGAVVGDDLEVSLNSYHRAWWE